MTGGQKNNQFCAISQYIYVPPSLPKWPSDRKEQISIVGGKACGLALLPPHWTPPYIVVAANAFDAWKSTLKHERTKFLHAICVDLLLNCSSWAPLWPSGLVLRSSAVTETIRERGAYDSIKITADYGGETICDSIGQIYEGFERAGAPGSIAVIIQALTVCEVSGHISNERRVSKTVNQWAWEFDEPWVGDGRFNSQRSLPPAQDATLALRSTKSINPIIKVLKSIGRWTTSLAQGPAHLEWGATPQGAWIFQIDFEDDQPDDGVNPKLYLRDGNAAPAGEPPVGSPLKIAVPGSVTGWSKLDKVKEFTFGRLAPYPKLFWILGSEVERSLKSGRDLIADLHTITGGTAVCRTDCSTAGIDRQNLPRTDTVSAEDAVSFMLATLGQMTTKGATPDEVCFIIHKFIPAHAAAWARAYPDKQIVLVDTLWGLPDGLQYLSHDTFEYDVKREEVSSEQTRHKPMFLQETETGEWMLIEVARRNARSRSLSLPDIKEVAQATQSIAQRLGKSVQVMWFCDVDSGANVGRNVPWYMEDAPEVSGEQGSVPQGAQHYRVQRLEDLDSFPMGLTVMDLEPEAGLFRNTDFIEAISQFSTQHNVPVLLKGSTLSHAYYTLQRNGVMIVGTDSGRTRTRKRQVFAKLVRDSVPARISEHGELVVTARIAKSQSRAALVAKLYEEGQELLSAKQPAEVQAELADVIEVVRSLCNATGLDWDTVLKTAESKKASRGSFEGNVVLMETSWPAWKERPRSSADHLIDLHELDRASSKGGHHVLNYPAAIAGGKGVVHLLNGQALRVVLTAKGVEIEELTSQSDKDPLQIELPFDPNWP